MDELECMKNIDDNLQAVPEDSTRLRIVGWLAAKYLGASMPSPVFTAVHTDVAAEEASNEVVRSGQIAGIAKLSNSGEVQLTVRDFKAKSANDAAIRLVHVLIWATARLTGATTLSSKNAIVPWLRKYRCYDGNTRWAIAKDKGLVRDGDELSLDFHSEQLAEKFVGEILDPSVEGKWKPGSTKRRATKSNLQSENV